MCESYATSNHSSLSFFPIMTRVSAGYEAPKIWDPPCPQEMQLDLNVLKFTRQKLREHGFHIPTELRRAARDVTNAFELIGKFACFPHACRCVPLFPLRCDWLVKPIRELLRFVVG